MNAKIIPDKYFTDNLTSVEFIEPIQDGVIKRNLYPILTKYFGSIEWKNFYQIFRMEFKVDYVKDNGYIIRPKGKRKNWDNRFYFPKCDNIIITNHLRQHQ